MRSGNRQSECRLLKSINMEDVWKANTLTQSEAKQWRSMIKEKIRDREETQWKERMQTKPKLIQPTQNKAAIRALISDDARQRSERSDDETERRNERTENRDRKICDHEQRQTTRTE